MLWKLTQLDLVPHEVITLKTRNCSSATGSLPLLKLAPAD